MVNGKNIFITDLMKPVFRLLSTHVVFICSVLSARSLLMWEGYCWILCGHWRGGGSVSMPPKREVCSG